MSIETASPDEAFDIETREALRDILTNPSSPVGEAANGPDGPRNAALREALDYICSARLLRVTSTPEASAATLAALAAIDPVLAATVQWHATLVPLLYGLPASTARNAVLGNVQRGEILTWATTVTRWEWIERAAPTAAVPMTFAEAEFEVGAYPGFYDEILVWDAANGALVVIPTHRKGLSWERQGQSPTWKVRLESAGFHVDELIYTAAPRLDSGWPRPAGDR
jgi:hypothetical protein